MTPTEFPHDPRGQEGTCRGESYRGHQITVTWFPRVQLYVPFVDGDEAPGASASMLLTTTNAKQWIDRRQDIT